MTSPFVWHELLTSDAAAAVAFYTATFGWRAEGTTLFVGDARVAGVGTVKLHPHWAPFVRVTDVEASVAAAVPGGGRVAGRPSSPAGAVLVDARGVPTVVTAAAGTDPFVTFEEA